MFDKENLAKLWWLIRRRKIAGRLELAFNGRNFGKQLGFRYYERQALNRSYMTQAFVIAVSRY